MTTLKRLLASSVLLLCLVVPLYGEVPLSIEGDTITVVKKLPFKVSVPAQKKALYIWNYPSTVKAKKDKNVLTVTEAPKGEVTVYIQVAVYDKEADDFTTTDGQITFVVGDVPPPVPPGPDPLPPDPKDPFLDALQKAYDSNTEADKKTTITNLANVFHAGGQIVREKKPETYGAFWKAFTAGEDAAKTSKKLQGLKTVCKEYAMKDFPTAGDAKLDDSSRDTLAKAMELCASKLEKIKK